MLLFQIGIVLGFKIATLDMSTGAMPLKVGHTKSGPPIRYLNTSTHLRRRGMRLVA